MAGRPVFLRWEVVEESLPDGCAMRWMVCEESFSLDQTRVKLGGAGHGTVVGHGKVFLTRLDVKWIDGQLVGTVQPLALCFFKSCIIHV